MRTSVYKKIVELDFKYDSAFSKLTTLANVKFNDNGEAGTTELGSSVFSGCTNLVEVSTAKNVGIIAYYPHPKSCIYKLNSSKEQAKKAFHFDIINLEILIISSLNLNRSTSLNLLFNEFHVLTGIFNTFSPDSQNQFGIMS